MKKMQEDVKLYFYKKGKRNIHPQPPSQTSWVSTLLPEALQEIRMHGRV